jgi:membrane protein implicated in regulation of membrane protease activity
MHVAAILAVAVWLLLFAGYALATGSPKPALALALVAALLIARAVRILNAPPTDETVD